jgi:predicted RNA-binding protein with PIN domain
MMPFLIDGYNLLWAINRIDADSQLSDVQLCQLLSRYLAATSESGEIIFDGIGPPEKEVFNNLRNLEVIFVGQKSDADTIIEDKIQMNTAPGRLTVVSSDRRIRLAARKRKAASIKCEEFWNNLCRQLSRKKHFSEPAEKQTGLNEGQTNLWLDFFGIEQ